MSMSSRRVLRAGIVPVVAALALAGCGSSDSGDTAGGSAGSPAKTTEAPKKPSGAELVKQAKATALAAKSGRVVGSVTDEGKQMSIDLAGTLDGTNQALTMGMGGEGEATILTVGGKNYMTGDTTFWTTQAGAEAAKMLDGKYVLVPAAEAKEMGDMKLKGLLDEIFAEDMSALESANSKVEETTVDGQKAYTLSDRVGGGGASMVVTADGKATLIKLTAPKDEPGEMTFSEWNAAKPVAAPSADSIIEPPQ